MEPNNTPPIVDRVRSIPIGALALCLVLIFGVGVLVNLHTSRSAALPQEEVPVGKPDPFEGISLSGKAAVVYDLRTGAVLYGLHEDAQLPLASLTKLLVAYTALDALSEHAIVPITASALGVEGDSGLVFNDTFTTGTLARISLVASSNDASEALMEAYERNVSGGGDINQGAAALLSQTYTINGTGLDESGEVAGGYGSAKDIAILMAALYDKYPQVLADTTYPERRYESFEGTTILAKNTNVIAERIPRFLGGKTGLTDLAGGNLAVLFDAGIDRPVAVVVLGATEETRFTDIMTLIDRTHTLFALSLTN